MKFFTKEVKIALAAILGILVLFYGLQFLKGLSIFSSSNTYYIVFNDVSGLSASSPIYANGYKVGVVERIDYDYDRPDRIVAVAGLDKAMRIPAGSRAELASDLLGNIKINLMLSGDPTRFIATGDSIPGGMEQGLMNKVGQMMPAVERMIPKLDSIMTSLNMLLADPALRNTLHNVEGMTDRLNQTSAELQSLSAHLNRNIPSVVEKADGVLDNTRQLTANLSAVDIATMTAQVNRTLENVEQMTRRLNSTEGSLGLLMNDTQLYSRLSATAASADSLLIDLKAHPKRYVHFSIFGRKDK